MLFRSTDRAKGQIGITNPSYTQFEGADRLSRE
jgi:hypothetical protein